MNGIRGRLTYANVMATIAVFIALGGASYAALKLPKNSVGRKQLKLNAVTSPKVKDGSLLAKDFKAGQLPAGPRGKAGKEGKRGPTGKTGPQGPAGATNTVVRYGPVSEVPTGSLALSNASCKAEEVVTGGGFQFVGERPATSSYFMTQDRPSIIEEDFPVVPPNGTKATGWVVSMGNETGSTFEFRSYVMCASP